MIKAKKFGAFAGVFTPSVLTILCVIMYMRLGWVVGQAGLIGALLIIVLAHVISISTGLSISSIATDKRIKAGGIYYILSRSLGLPIGGAIGIALLLGTALSISLYIIGFAENFLGLEVIRNFLGLEQNVVGIRIVGTAAFLILLIIAFISTSVAIKSQFYIMAAIGLSLVSIVIGLFINGSINPDSFSISYLHDGVSPEIIFAIFFPAVTGFTAGVAMSGDLKNPNKNIPRGTLAAIAVGFIIYSALAVGFALFVDRELLLTDYNFLMKIAWFAPLVVAGIWGATLSSAMGGILGGPRILQAISSDKITPKIFARGYGASNEPRNALLLIFVIAEAGILVGELDVIAGIVTMFYLVSYGMINIAFFLESWASVDFRPSFNVNRYIGLVGFIAAFGVMFQIDFILMFVAVGFMLILFFYLKRKELGSEYGDVWQSVYSSLMRATLHRMDHRKMEERNWQPNIVLFSGGTKKRPHLIDFGKALVGKHGVLSNFDLHESKHAKAPFPKPIHTQQSTEDETGVFTRRRTVRDIYDGIELISGIYGFSGFEPNSVLLGWGRHTRDPERFVEMLNNLYNLDLNVLLLDYDKKAGFGKFGTIDIWWKDRSNQGNLALALSKLLLLSDSWGSANIRLIIVNSHSNGAENIHREAEQLLDSLRILATVKVINNHIEQRTFYEILLAESHSTDLVITGIPEIEKGKEADFVERTNNLLNQVGTVLLINASSTFKKERLFVDTHPYIQIPQDSGVDLTHEIKPSSEHVLPEEAPEELKELHASCLQLVHSLCYDYIQPVFTYNINKIGELENIISESFQTIESKPFQSLSDDQQTRQLTIMKTNQLIRTGKIIGELQQTIQTKQREGITRGLNTLLAGIREVAEEAPGKITVHLYPRHMVVNEKDNFSTKGYKRLTRILRSEKKLEEGIPYTIRFQHLIRESLPEAFFRRLDEGLGELGQFSVAHVEEFRQLLDLLHRYFILFEQKGVSQESLANGREEITEAIEKLKKLNAGAEEILLAHLAETISALFDDIYLKIDSGPANLNIGHSSKGYMQRILKKFAHLPERWSSVRDLLYNGISIDIKLKLFSARLKKIVEHVLSDIDELTSDRLIRHAEILNEHVSKYLEELRKDPSAEFHLNEEEIEWGNRTNFQLSLDRIIDKSIIGIKALVNKFPAQTDLLNPAMVQDPGLLLDKEMKRVVVPTYQLVDYHVQSNLFEPLEQVKETLPATLYHAASRIRNSLRLISIGNVNMEAKSTLEMVLREEESPGIYPGRQGLLTFATQQGNIVAEEMKSIRNTLYTLRQDFEHKICHTTDELTLSRLLKTPYVYKQYAKKRKSQQKRSLFLNAYRSLKLHVVRISAGVWYKQSDALLYAKKISQGEGKLSTVDALLTLRERVTPSDEVLNKLPFYYRQLFLQKFNFKSEFWVNRKKEISIIERAISRYMQGSPGGILIRGERSAGKTFFLNYISTNLYPGHPVYALNSPPAGSADPKIFLKTLRESTGLEGSAHRIFSSLEENSLIVIDDLELWWEKSEKGSAVVQLIGELIRKYGQKCLFIITATTNSYRVINQMNGIESCFLSTVDLQPFNARSIREALMFRHQSSELEIRRADKRNSRFSRTTQAKLFAHYFNYTKGNIGAALLAWMAHITDVQDNILFIRQPHLPDHSMLEQLSPEILVYLSQFIFHKRLNVPKLQRITMDSPAEVKKQLLFLKRAGLINERAGHIYELNRYIYIHLKHIIH